MGKPNLKREALYRVFKEELAKWSANQGTSFHGKQPDPLAYGLTEWEGGALARQLGLVLTPPATVIEYDENNAPF